MAGISSKALNFGGPANKYKFNGKEMQSPRSPECSLLFKSIRKIKIIECCAETVSQHQLQRSCPEYCNFFYLVYMNEGGYKIRNQAAVHFITFAVVEWIDVFTRKDYRDIVLDSIRHCQNEKGLLLHCWCIMSNHLHLIASAKTHDLSDILRDFKKFTSKQIIKAIQENQHESRKEWMLKTFRQAGEANSRNSEFQFWRQDNQPMELYSPKFVFQKINYIHNNPVEAGIVEKPEHYLYSSARDYFQTKKCGLLDLVFL